MKETVTMPGKEYPTGIDVTTEDEYSSQARLLQEFTNIPSVNKSWIFKSDTENTSRAMFSISQPNLLANKKRTLIHSSHISKTSDRSVNFQWSPFPIEMTGVSTVVPSPSGSKLLVVRNKENEAPTQLEIWGSYQLEKEIQISQSTHGSIYTDGWFEGISWNHEENLIAYIAEEPAPLKPLFNDSGYKKDGSTDKDCGSWKGQGDWEEDWGETYSKKGNPSLFVVNISSGEVQAVEGIPKSLSAGQVVWAPSTSRGCNNYLVFAGWLSENGPNQTPRKLGIKYCYNRPCALYAIKAPFQGSDTEKIPFNADEAKDNAKAVNLTLPSSSAFFPQFSPDGRTLVFLSAKSAVDSGAHGATESLYKMDWLADGKLDASCSIIDVVPVVMCPEGGRNKTKTQTHSLASFSFGVLGIKLRERERERESQSHLKLGLGFSKSNSMGKKSKLGASRLDEVDRSMYSTFCSAANSLSQVYSQAMNHQKLSFQAGERHGLEEIYQWILRQHEEGSRVTVVDILSHIQNEMDYGEDPSMFPRLDLPQQYPQTATHFPNAGMQTSSGIFGQASVGLAPRPSYSDQAKNMFFSNALSSPVRRSLQHYHLSQGGSRNHEATSPDVNRESNSPSNDDSSMDMH